MTFTLLHKAAMVVNRFKVSSKQLDWLFEYGSEVGWLDLNTLPAASLSLWLDDPTPQTPDANDPAVVELGVKIRTDVAGWITGLRFYKAKANTGPHVAHLWAGDGTMLAKATFADETASGWQTVDFDPPVPVSPKTTYIASYHTEAGHYAQDVSYFSGKNVGSGPLHALADGADGGNGIYIHGTGGFPNQTSRREQLLGRRRLHDRRRLRTVAEDDGLVRAAGRVASG